MRPTCSRTTLVGLLVAAAVTAGGTTTALAAPGVTPVPAAQTAAGPAAVDGARPQLPVPAPDPATRIAGLGALGGVTQQVQSLVASATAKTPPAPADLQAQADKVKSALDTLVATVPAPAGSPALGAARPPADLPVPAPSLSAPVPVPVPDPLKDAAAKLQADVTALLDAVKSGDPTKVVPAVTGIATDTLALAVATVTGLGGTLPV